jgi:heptosyltransferase-2
VRGILIIQTAFIGDVVLATSLIEKLHAYFPDQPIDFLVRKGNEPLLENNPFLRSVIIWDKKKSKNKNLFRLIKKIRENRYDKIINVQRFLSTGILTAFSGAKEKIGFDKNPMSWAFTKKVTHHIDPAAGKHEIERNHALISSITDAVPAKPKLYPSEKDYQTIKSYCKAPFITITPSSVWFTKKYPPEKWLDFIHVIPPDYQIYLLGGPDNVAECDKLLDQVNARNAEVLAGKLGFLQSAALMKFAVMNYVNDSAPLHFCSAMNAPVTAVFCSTIPGFGYTPLSDNSFVVETNLILNCRPCGLHGRKACPLGHFNCARSIQTEQLTATLK